MAPGVLEFSEDYVEKVSVVVTVTPKESCVALLSVSGAGTYLGFAAVGRAGIVNWSDPMASGDIANAVLCSEVTIKDHFCSFTPTS